MSPEIRWVVAVVAVVLGFAFLGGCQDRGADVAAAPQRAQAGGGEGASGGGPGQRHRGPRYVVRRVSAVVEVARVDRAIKQLRREVAREGGWIANASVRHEDAPEDGTAHVSARVPVTKLDRVRAAIAELGELQSEDESAEDVTDQVVDRDARLNVARAEERRLLELLERTGSLADVLAVERELAARREIIERLEAEQATVMEQVEYAELSVELQPRSIAFWEKPGESISASAAAGVDIAAAIIVGTASAAAALGPTVAMIAVLIFALVMVWRAMWRRRRGRVVAAS